MAQKENIIKQRMKVAHDLQEILEDNNQEVILTLKDSNLLKSKEQEDVLEDVLKTRDYKLRRFRYLKNLNSKNQFQNVDYNLRSHNDILQKYDELEEQDRFFYLDQVNQVSTQQQKSQNQELNKLKLETPKIIANDYQNNTIQFKKPKSIKRKREDPSQFEEQEEGNQDKSENLKQKLFEEIQKKQKVEKREQTEQEMETNELQETIMKKIKENQKILRGFKKEEEMEALDSQQLKLKQISKDIQQRNEITLMKNKDKNIEDCLDGSNSIVQIPLPSEKLAMQKLQKSRTENIIETQSQSKENQNVKEEDLKLIKEAKKESSNQKKSEQVFQEQIIGDGMASVLQLLRTNGTLKKPKKEQIIGRANDKKPAEEDEEQTLHYRDEKGRELSKKEAWRQFCQKFHGIYTGKNKKEKRLFKQELKEKLQKQDPRAYSQTYQSFSKVTKKVKTNFMVIPNAK